MEQAIIGRQNGQGFYIELPHTNEKVYVEIIKCTNGYVRLLIEQPGQFSICRWDGEEREKRVRSVPNRIQSGPARLIEEYKRQ